MCKDWFLFGKNRKFPISAQLGMEKCKNRKMHILIGHGKNVKITKYLSQLGIEKNAKIAKCLKMKKQNENC